MAVTFSGWNKNLESHINDKNNPHAVSADQVGAVPFFGLAKDLNDILNNGKFGFYYINGDTLNSPFEEGKTQAKEAMVLNIPHGIGFYSFQMCYFKGSEKLMMRNQDGEETISPWHHGFLKENGGTLTGSIYGSVGVEYFSGNGKLIGFENSVEVGAGDRRVAILNTGPIESQIFLINSYNDAANRYYQLYGEHNKPYASYNGTGGQSTILVLGTLVRIVAITAYADGGILAFVTNNGAIVMGQNGTFNITFDAYLQDGTLSVTGSSRLDKIGTTYYVHAL